LNAYTFHITPYDLAFLGTVFIGLAFSLLLWYGKSMNRAANQLLCLALLAMVLWMVWLLGIDVGLGASFPRWSWLPLQFSMAPGPLIYLYARKLTWPGFKPGWKNLLHFAPLLLEQSVFVLEVKESIKTGTPTYETLTFQHLNPALQLLAFISITVYLYHCGRMIKGFHQRLRANVPGASVYELRWLQRLLLVFSLLWLLWIPYVIVDSYYHYHLGIQAFFPLYLLLAVMAIWIGGEAILRPETEVPVMAATPPKPSVPTDLMQKGLGLKKAMEIKSFYRDAELTLGSLAEKLDVPPHELSRIINIAFGKNFNDLINEYRIRDVTLKMQDPAYDHITLLGIAFDCGFNSKTTFNRTFKQITGKNPADYKNDLKKKRPSYNLERRAHITAVNSPPEAIQVWSSEKFKRNYMIKNYFKVAWRYMLANKVYSVLNIAGLATGMAVALLIGLWINGQYLYDRFLPDYDRIYQVKLNFFHSGEVHTQSGSALPLVEEFRKNYPEVKYASETDWGGRHSLVLADKKLDPSGLTVGTDFLKIFRFPLIEGNISSVFADPNSIVLTESVAKALFGNDDPLNKVIRIDNKNNIKVTGVMKDVPANSTLQFSYLLPYSYLEQTNPDAKKERTHWGNYSYPEYVELQPDVNVEAFESKIKNIVGKHGDVNKIEVILQPAKNWHLLTGFRNGKAVDGFIQYVHIFGIIGILVLVIACINFVNLSTARAEKRAREVGVRKSIGSLRRHLIIQFLTESLLITFVAFAASILFVQLSLPYFNTITLGNITIPYDNVVFWGMMVAYVLFTGLLAGSRPAFYLSSFKPVQVLKGTVQLGKRATLPRKILVVIQFSCSIALIISTLVIYQQIKYAKDRPKGYNAERLIMVNSSDDLSKNYTALKNDLLQSGQVTSVTRAAAGMLYFTASFTILDWPGKKVGESLEMVTTAVSQDYFKTVGMTFAAGHEFGTEAGPDTLNIVINESAVEKLRLKTPVNQLITFEYSKKPMRVIGVVKNAVVGSPFYLSNPAIYVYNPGWTGSIMFRLKPTVNMQQAIAKASAIFNTYNPSFPFEYSFADEMYANSYTTESLVGTLSTIFAVLAIFISCLGLFGLAAYIAEQRKKEIGIRKVLGASISQVWFLLSGDFLLLVIISCVIASPVALYFLQGWLQKFEYRITIGAGAFVLSAVIAVLITIFTISYQAIESALVNPVNSLRSE
jgi:putative ABC transport system permease protein